MGQLGARDLDAVLEFTLEVRAFHDLEAFRHGILSGVRRLVPGDLVGYNEIDVRRGSMFAAFEPADGVFDGIEGRFLALSHQHPVVARHQSDRQTLMVSDFLSERQFHRLELYQDMFRLLDAEDQIAFGLPGEAIIGIAINRAKRSFCERDRQVLELLRPHLAQAYEQVRAWEQAEGSIRALQSGLEECDAAIIMLDRRRRVAHAGANARALLRAYFGSPPEDGTLLPQALATWVQTDVGPDKPPMITSGARGQLVVRELGTDPSGWYVLLLEEKRARPPTVESLRSLGLTEREAQVARLLACGKRNQQISRELSISTATVRKHLEHIYRRLGVDSRAHAITRMLS